MKILQINTQVNSGSTGRHTENVGKILLSNGHDSSVAYGRGNQPSESKLIKVGDKWDQGIHLLVTRLFDKHGLSSVNATKRLIPEIKKFNPDLIHLRNIHGYYLNYEILFEYLIQVNRPVVWTFHDCWPFTGHCSHFERVNCYRWQTKCFECPNKKGYPASYLFDRSTENFLLKKHLFASLQRLQIITPSDWLTNHVKKSFFKNYPVQTINNGIDLNTFKPQNHSVLIEYLNLNKKKVILGVANVWNKHKGLNDITDLSRHLTSDQQIILIGLKENQIKKLPANIIGIKNTKSIQELAEYYSLAQVFINPTYADNFPTTNIEALACGTPVITYNTGGSPEAIDNETGIVVEKGNIEALAHAIEKVLTNGKAHYSEKCRTRAVALFNKDERYRDYLDLYESMLKIG